MLLQKIKILICVRTEKILVVFIVPVFSSDSTTDEIARCIPFHHDIIPVRKRPLQCLDSDLKRNAFAIIRTQHNNHMHAEPPSASFFGVRPIGGGPVMWSVGRFWPLSHRPAESNRRPASLLSEQVFPPMSYSHL